MPCSSRAVKSRRCRGRTAPVPSVSWPLAPAVPKPSLASTSCTLSNVPVTTAMRVAPAGTSKLPNATVPLDALSVCSILNAPLHGHQLGGRGDLAVPGERAVAGAAGVRPARLRRCAAHTGAGTPNGIGRPLRRLRCPRHRLSALANGVTPSGASSFPVIVAEFSGGVGAGAGPRGGRGCRPRCRRANGRRCGRGGVVAATACNQAEQQRQRGEGRASSGLLHADLPSVRPMTCRFCEGRATRPSPTLTASPISEVLLTRR